MYGNLNVRQATSQQVLELQSDHASSLFCYWSIASSTMLCWNSAHVSTSCYRSSSVSHI